MLLLIALLTVGGFAATAMMRRSPAWWRAVDVRDPETLVAARDVEDGLTTLFHMDRRASPSPANGQPLASDEWRFTVRAGDANAWLNTRLPAWLTRSEDLSSWPDEVRQLQVDFRNGTIWLGVELDVGGMVRVLSAEVHPEVREDGSLWLPARVIRIGTLPLPAGAVLSTAKGRADDLVPASIRRQADTNLLWNAFLGRSAVALEPAIRLPDGRRVRILGLRASGGVLEVRCRTEWEPQAPSASAPLPDEASMQAGPTEGFGEVGAARSPNRHALGG
ncbi:MAG: hypothetical protein KDA05_04565 [Phycisphaerales bacterium]|nr:hypothetical protein [Phycisphaerales bacterium]